MIRKIDINYFRSLSAEELDAKISEIAEKIKDIEQDIVVKKKILNDALIAYNEKHNEKT